MFGGIIVIYAVGWLPALDQLIIPGLAGIALFGLTSRNRHRSGSPPRLSRVLRTGCLLAGTVIAGMIWAAENAQQRAAEQFPQQLEQQTLKVSGYTCSVPAPGAWSSVRQDFCVTHWHLDEQAGQGSRSLPVPAKLRLSRYNAEDRFSLAGPAVLEVSLKRPHGSVNPDGFRYETWLYRQGYLATGSVRAVLESTAEASASSALPPCGLACRYHLGRQNLVKTLNDKAAGMTHIGLVESLWLGSRGQLQPADWDVLRATGTSHLVAISGLHVGLIATMVGFLARFLLLRTVGDRYGPRMVPIATYILVCLAAAGYALLAGFTVPTQRALVMVVVAGTLLLRGRHRKPWDAWILALFLVILVDPFAILDIGFWLSFGAVACLILGFGGRLAAPSAWRSLVAAQVAITLGLWPILAMLGIDAAPLGLLANLFAIPWLSAVVMPVLMLAVPFILLGGMLGHGAMLLLDSVLATLWWVLAAIAGQGGNLGALPAVPVWLLILLATAGILMLLPVGLLYRLVGAGLAGALALKLATAAPANTAVAHPQVMVMDVGQGLAVLLRDGESAMLYDTGPAGGGFSAAESQILPSFESLGVKQLDLLVLSHADNDHAGAWQTVAQRMKPGSIVSGESRALAATVLPCEYAHGLAIGRWRLQAWRAENPDDSNGKSCVIEAAFGAYRVALTGDIGKAEERAWLARRGSGEVDLLLAPHHGSKSSSGLSMVAALAPAHTVFSAGYRNPYGHPHADVIARYRRHGEVLSTAGAGALTFTFTDEIKVRAERDHAPFWIKPPEPLANP